jgi:hypothetical protein
MEDPFENTENDKHELTVNEAKEILLEHRDYCSPEASKYDERLINAINTVLNELDNAMDFIKTNKF